MKLHTGYCLLSGGKVLYERSSDVHNGCLNPLWVSGLRVVIIKIVITFTSLKIVIIFTLIINNIIISILLYHYFIKYLNILYFTYLNILYIILNILNILLNIA